MAQIAGLKDLRGEGPPADIGTFQMPCSILVFQFTFSGTTYNVAMRAGVPGWVLITPPSTVAATVIQAAFNGLTAGQEKVVLKGNFTVNHVALKIPSYAIVELQGKITFTNIDTMNMIENSDQVGGNTQIEWVGGELDGNKANNPFLGTDNLQNILFFYKVNGLSVRGCYVHDSPHVAVYMNDYVTNAEVVSCRLDDSLDNEIVAEHNCQYIIFSNNIIQSTYSGIHIEFEASHITIANNVVNSASATAIGVVGDGTRHPSMVTVVGNVLRSSYKGITVRYAHDCVVDGNVVSDCNLGIEIASYNTYISVSDNEIYNSTTYGIELYTSSDKCLVTGNLVNTVGASGILIDHCNYVSVIGNLVTLAQTTGIRLQASSYSLAEGNYVINCNQVNSGFEFGLDLREAGGVYSLRNVVEGNYVISTGAPLHVYSIYVEAGCNYNAILGNRLSGASAALIGDAGTGTILPTVRACFVKELGTAAWLVTAAGPMGIVVDAANEGALAKVKLPLDLQQVVRIVVWGVSHGGAEAHGMQLQVAAGAGGDNEAWNAEDIAVASKTSSTLNFANLENIYWVFTSADDADIGDLAAGDFLQWCCYYAAVSGDNMATDLLLAGEGLEIQYV